MSLEENEKYRCPCCGYKTLDPPPHYYEICEVCYWQDNIQQFDRPDYRGGPNKGVSLNEARANFRKFGAFSEEFIGKTRKGTPINNADIYRCGRIV